ncbi:MAG: hypothetical protein Q9174_000395 [Haloplaca sp. 1 TL-2023]
MAAMSSGKAKKAARVVKGGTSTKKKHRFESFTQRIAKLNIDPVHKSRQREINLNGDDPTASYFKTDLDRWKDLNLSQNFSNFIHEMSQLCNNLPQVLHYQKEIARILSAFIAKGDSLSLEPLLSLLSSFAHDLASSFEPYFSDAVTLVTTIAARSSEFEVIEWSFNCLAWLFKYLSRLLVPDLRPLLRIMSPLMGRASQKIFITRFAAESMSFLVRKTALLYHKNQRPLQNVLEFILQDLDEVSRQGLDTPLYDYGVKTLLVDAVKGIDRGLHSTGPTIYESLLENSLRAQGATKGHTELLEGVTVSLIHHTEAQTFGPFLDLILKRVRRMFEQSHKAEFSTDGQAMCERLLCVLATVRKGSRVQDWGAMLDVLLCMLKTREERDEKPTKALYEAAVVIMQSAPLDILVSKVRPIMDRISHCHDQDYFLVFCSFFCDLDKERFESLIHPYFIKYSVPSDPVLFGIDGVSVATTEPKAKVSCPGPWQEEIISLFEGVQNSDDERLIADCYGYLNVFPYLNISVSARDAITRSLESMLHSSLKMKNEIGPKSILSFGEGFKACAGAGAVRPINGARKWRTASMVAEQYRTLPSYLEGILASLRLEDSVQETDLEDLVQQMVENLSTSSHVLRDLSLRIIQIAYQKSQGSSAETLDTMLTIENTPLDLKSARTVSMYIRKLASQQKDNVPNAWLRKAVPHFCFGIQTYKLSPIWNDAIEVLKQVCEEQQGENIVAHLAFGWLETPAPRTDDQESSIEQPVARSLDEFQCSNLIHVDAVFQNCAAEMENPQAQMIKNFRSSQAMPTQQPANGAAIALRILLEIPKTAEKRSRHLVPLFLQWAVHDEDEDRPTDSPAESDSRERDASRTKLIGGDRKSLLRVFSLFSNPRSVYRSAEVFNAMQNLLANGDVEMQTLALKAIFTWKLEALQAYQTNLLNILDDARFKDEIATFLHTEEEESLIQEKHRPQLVPVLLRLLYGKLIARTGNQVAKKTQGVRRKVILGALSRFHDDEIEQFLDIAFGSILPSRLADVKKIGDPISFQDMLAPRKQVGLLNMAKDMLAILGSRLKPFTTKLTKVVVHCLVWACRGDCSNGSDTVNHEGSPDSMLRAIRQLGLQCLNLLFQNCVTPEIRPCMRIVFSEAIDPRLPSLPVETAQSVSGQLQLFSTWASSHDSATILVEHNPQLLGIVSSCLEVTFAKEEVKMFVLDNILKRLVSLATLDGPDSPALLILEEVLRPNIDIFLTHVGALLRKSPSRELLASAIDFVTRLAPMVQGSSQIHNMLETASFLLNQPPQRVNPRIKGDLLQILQHFVPHHDFSTTRELQDRIFCTISSLFGYFKDRQNRIFLVEVLSALADKDKDITKAAALCRSLNSYSAGKVDEPDFDDRLQAFNMINERIYASLTTKEWRPLLHNLLFYIRDTEELAIRSNAAFGLRRFIEVNPISTISQGSEEAEMIKSVLLPALRRGASESSELVRTEYLAVMAHLVRSNSTWNEVSDMSTLLVGDDDEASFFTNILHIQQHRRLRALRRLATEARQDHLHTNNVAQYFLPLIEHFVFDKADDESAHNLSAETVTTIGALAMALEWPQFRAVFGRYIGYVESKPDLEKTIIKLVGVLADTLATAAAGIPDSSSVLGESERSVEEPASQQTFALARSLPRSEKLAEDLARHLIPALTKYLHEKDESTVSLRVPVAVSAVKLFKMLPPPQMQAYLPPVLTDVCNILRSRAQESRDLTRRTLVDITVVAGPSYFGFVLKELRRALARGYQLHVLSYTVHSILVGSASAFQLGDLDYCIPQIVAIIMDDIFGTTGQEKDAEEYISKMKEVKSSKSYDSMEMVAKAATAQSFSHLIQPLQSLLEERLDLKRIRKMDELLRRIGLGLLHNEAIKGHEVLVFCHEIIREVYQPAQEQVERASGREQRNKRFLINVKGVEKANRGTLSSNRFKLVRFAFDLMRSVLHRYDSLRTPANLAGFMPMLGDAMLQSNEEIQMSALRLLATIIAVPLKEIDDNAAIYIAEAVKIVKASPSTNTELAQAAVKLVSSILRERREVEIREMDIAFLLKRSRPDLEELDRQGAAFNFLKAVMARRIVIVEMYEVLETVASMMVTNQTKGARDQARSVYFDFLIRYPQGKGRFSKQLAFLVKNLDYKHQEGRQSVMEAIHLLLSKLSDDPLQAAMDSFFVPLLMVMVNDEAEACREMAGALVKAIFERADVERSESFLTLLRAWLRQPDQPLLVRVALQVYSIYLDSRAARREKSVPFLLGQVKTVLQVQLDGPEEADWELLYYALQSLSKTCQILPVASFHADNALLWNCVRRSLSYPHAWVKLSAAKLQGMFFADIARTNTGINEMHQLPLQGSSGLQLTGADIETVTRASLGMFKTPALAEELATQTVRNLVFLAKTMNNISWNSERTLAMEGQGVPMLEAENEFSDGDEDALDRTGESDSTRQGASIDSIIRRASAVLRTGPRTTQAPSLIPLKAAMQLLWALCNNLPNEAIQNPMRIEWILLPLQHLTDTSIAAPFSADERFVEGYKALVSHASEIMDMLQKKLGTTEYIMHLTQVKNKVKERREGRRIKRRIESVAEPERMGRYKQRKGEKKKEKRKEKSAGQRSKRRGW